MTHVFVADDHAVVRLGLRHVLEEIGGFRVVGEADNGRAVLDASLDGCDALVLDLSLPVVSGGEVLRRLRARHPTLAIVVHSMHPADQFRRRAIADGADDYVSKERPPADLIHAIRLAVAGRRHGLPTIDVEPSAPSPAAHAHLTQREHQILMLIVQGRQVADIAAELDVFSCTVSNHLARVRQKLGVQTVAEMVRYALGAGLLARDPMGPEPGGAGQTGPDAE